MPNRLGQRSRQVNVVAWVIASVVIVLIPSIVNLAFGNSYYVDYSEVAAAISVSSICFVAALFSRPAVVLWILVPFTALSPVETIYIIEFSRPSDFEAIGSLFETNSLESIELLGWNRLIAISAMMAICAVVGVVAAWNARHLPKVQLRVRLGLLVVVMGYWAIANHAIIWSVDLRLPAVQKKPGENAPIEYSRLWRAAADSFPVGVVMKFGEYLVEKARYDQLNQLINSVDFGASRRADAQGPDVEEIYILAIGESVRRDNWGMNGYARETTPQLARQSGLINFPDVVSPWQWTRRAVPMMLTRRGPTHSMPEFQEPGFLVAFEEAGFKSAWISNHRVVGPSDSLIGLYAHQAETVVFPNLAHWRQGGTYDEVLLPPLSRFLDKPEKKKVAVLHMLGSHFNYTMRYPPGFARYPVPGLLLENDANTSLEKKESVWNAYDNSILYTDHILSQIINMIKARRAVSAVLYFSDHGENLISSECAMANHGQNSIHDFLVPGFVWLSDEYIEKYPERSRRIRSNAGARLSTDISFESMLGLGAIEVPDLDHGKDIGSEVFTERTRFVNAGRVVDFDRVTPMGSCSLIGPGPGFLAN